MKLTTFKKPSILPGFGLSLGVTLLYLSLIVLIPLACLFLKAGEMSLNEFFSVISAPRVMGAFKLTLWTSFLAAIINVFFGVIIAWVIVRYDIPMKKLVEALIDLPFALPTAVAGIALTAIFSNTGWIGAWLAGHDIKVAFTPSGIVIALIFVGMPFIVRTVQPVLQDFDREVEEAAASLGASRIQTFRYVILPAITPAILTGFAMAFARGIGEYGSVIFIAGNIPMVSEIIPLLIVIKLEQYDYRGAAAIAVLMLLASFFMLLVINTLQKWTKFRLSNA